MKKKFISLFLLLLILFASNVSLSPAASKTKDRTSPKAVPNQLLVKFKNGVDADTAKRILYNKGAVAIKTFRLDPHLFLVEFPKNHNLKGKIASLKKFTGIKYIERNGIYKALPWKKNSHKKNRTKEVNYYVIR